MASSQGLGLATDANETKNVSYANGFGVAASTYPVKVQGFWQ